MNEWQNFLIAEAGAAAALTGLIFVGVSINLTKILSIPQLPDRALQALILLFTILIFSSLLLVPGQSVLLISLEVSGLGAIIWVVATVIDIGILRKKPIPYRGKFLFTMAMTQLAVLPYLIAGIILLSGNPSGIYWIVPGILISFLKSLLDAWVLLIEINR